VQENIAVQRAWQFADAHRQVVGSEIRIPHCLAKFVGLADNLTNSSNPLERSDARS